MLLNSKNNPEDLKRQMQSWSEENLISIIGDKEEISISSQVALGILEKKMKDWNISKLASVPEKNYSYHVYNIALKILKEKISNQSKETLEINSVHARHEIIKNLSKRELRKKES